MFCTGYGQYRESPLRDWIYGNAEDVTLHDKEVCMCYQCVWQLEVKQSTF